MTALQIAIIIFSVLSIIAAIVFVFDKNQIFSKRNLVALLLVVVSVFNIISVLSSGDKRKKQ